MNHRMETLKLPEGKSFTLFVTLKATIISDLQITFDLSCDAAVCVFLAAADVSE